MQIAMNDKDIVEFMAMINRYRQEHPILVDKYLMGKEIEVDAVCDGENILIPELWSTLSVPVFIPVTVSPFIRHRRFPEKIQEVLSGLYKKTCTFPACNWIDQHSVYRIQDEVYVIEVNPRSAKNRTIYQ